MYDSDGNLLYSDDDSGVDTNSLIQFQASYTGKYFVSAGAYSDNFEGDYSLTFTLDDFAGDTSSNGEIKYGQEILGNLEVAGDKDWVALNTNEGDQFQIDLIGGTLDDAYLSLYNLKELVASNDDFSSEEFNSKIYQFYFNLFRNFFISVEGFKDRYKGSYSLSVELISSDLNAEGQLIALNSDLEVLNYIACNEDLITAFGTNINEAKDHYERYGSSEEGV